MSLQLPIDTTHTVVKALSELLPFVLTNDEVNVSSLLTRFSTDAILTPWTRSLFASLPIEGHEKKSILHIASEQAAKSGSFAITQLLLDAFVTPSRTAIETSELNKFATIPEAVEAIKQGRFVVVVDDESRENEGDLIMASELVTEEAIAFMVRYTSGLICVSLTGERLGELNLPLMVQENSDTFKTAFTVSVDYNRGTTTGISAADRAKTLRALCSVETKPTDLNRPGHIFPLRYCEGGVIRRPGHTEASLDLARMANLFPSGVLCEITNDDGTMSRRPQLSVFCRHHGLLMITIKDLIDYRLAHGC
eukprot:TRINITY_DN7653_c0_g1_i1.p1 TRINITY_DN7653_c0_g1~~TRINITY_DN7653_c0_g1_i1.p1  ORF type:complete len:308 (-),score=65.60 TRINITY_DN7653_c0_g1_i1:368-1291(-)